MTGEELSRREPDGTMVRHADLSSLSRYGWNEIVVDGRGNIYVNSVCFGFMAGEEPRPGIIALVTLGGPDRRTLFMLAAEWEGTGNVDDAVARRTGRVVVADAPAPGIGWP